MESGTQSGYLLLADISGYTSFMAGTELEHSQAIVREVNDLVISSLTPIMTLAEVEGDAVFLYCPVSSISRGESIIEMIENSYVRFHNQREVMKTRTTCTCRACNSIQALDLKYVLHVGEYVTQTYGRQLKPVGSDVNLSHRLLKNGVVAATGWSAYALFTQQSLQALGVQLHGLREGTETYEHFPPVNTCSLNLAKRYEEINATRRYQLESVDDSFVIEFQHPPFVVWGWLNDLDKRMKWSEEDAVWSTKDRPEGRTQVGATNHCAHGKGELSVETILDWRPFEYAAAEITGGPLTVFMTDRLEEVDGGTRLTWQLMVKTRLPRLLHKPFARFISRRFIRMEKSYKRMRDLMNAESAPHDVRRN